MWGLLWHCLIPCLVLLFLQFQAIGSFTPSAKRCRPKESSALLHFKNSISVDSSASSYCEGNPSSSSYPRTESWNKSNDCCLWDGITCDRFTGHVIGLNLSSSWLVGSIHSNSSLFLLHHLQKLNLACNDFSGSKISSNFGEFTKLTHLDLSSSHFRGLVPTEMFHLSKLASLDLSARDNDDFGVLKLDQHGFHKLLQNLTELRYLYLNGVNMSSVKGNSLANLSSSLISLSLDYCSLQGEFPNDIFHLPFLQKLWLSGNEDLFGRLPKSNWSSPLRSLDLSSTLFSGMLYDTIGNLISLNELDLSDCQFIGSLPTSLWNLTGITFLNLGSNNFSGQVSGLLSNLGQLNHLYLSRNRFSGEFPDVFGNLSKLVVGHALANNFTGYLPPSAFSHIQLLDLDLSYNQFEGHIPQVSHLLNLTDRIPSLGDLDLSNNKLSGPVSNSIFEHVNLVYLNLSSNKLSGIVKSEEFSKLENLELVDFSYNDLLSLKSDMVDFILPEVEDFRFSSCNLTEFPIFLGNSKRLENLDLSNNSIVGQVSLREFKDCKLTSLDLSSNLLTSVEHIDCKSLSYLDLSGNFLTSVEHISLMTNLQFLNLQSNLLEGSLMVLPDLMAYFSVSNNKLTGQIPESFCNLRFIQHLGLSNNSFTGTIPQCLENREVLHFLDLRTNNFHGHIPSFLDCPFDYLNLNGNQLNGSLPPSLVNCHYLKVLDVGNNMINDTFPHWLGSLPELKVVVLKSNKFHGPIEYSTARFPFTKLQILDLSHNQFTGPLPIRYFEKSEAMMRGDKGSPEVDYMGAYSGLYTPAETFEYFSMVFVVKGVTMEIERILSILVAMDLSNNQFRGSIPEIVGKFNSLELLNFSNNNLIGHIPSSLGNLTKLESLDLSSNRLVGEIPKQLASLISLEVLNLSYNQLVGPIPEGSQFNTFSNDSYIGNLGLCGFPMSKECSTDKPNEPPSAIFPEDDNDPGWFDWKIAMMGYGSGLVIGLSIGYIVFTTRKPEWLIRMVEREGPTNVRSLNRRRQGRRNP
ncbi:hypothetical protein Patl1_03529 [Pistacia atlantica]|uniref:Uncharacterized protein n=1 Tax=Pistacia atlantica TaxID=434234 RepID=A0ACC1CD31_9ROSI|nr:hypothetical protein Patl1_03529 [Pistacia atlantica]